MGTSLPFNGEWSIEVRAGGFQRSKHRPCGATARFRICPGDSRACLPRSRRSAPKLAERECRGQSPLAPRFTSRTPELSRQMPNPRLSDVRPPSSIAPSCTPKSPQLTPTDRGWIPKPKRSHSLSPIPLFPLKQHPPGMQAKIVDRAQPWEKQSNQ
jgi:hypothetical protein